MRALYYMKAQQRDFFAACGASYVKELRAKYKNPAIYQPCTCAGGKNNILKLVQECDLKQDFFYSFEPDCGQKEYFQNPSAFYKKILDDFEALSAKHDFVLVLSFSEMFVTSAYELNLKLARHLNLPLLLATDELQDFKRQIALQLGFSADTFAFINADEKLAEKVLKQPSFMTEQAFEHSLLGRAKADKKIIVLPESSDERILQAASRLLEVDAAELILLGSSREISQKATLLGINLEDARIINPGNSQYDDELAGLLYEARKAKGMSLEEAKTLAQDKNYFATLLVHANHAHGMVSGALGSTADTIRPALQIIKTKPGASSVSGAFFICLEDRVYLFADCAVVPNPTALQLGELAGVCADTAKAFGLDPKIAYLSYSSGESGKGPSIDFVKEALALAKSANPELAIDGPLQFDAAVDGEVAKSKMPNSSVAGQANVFIFPDLNSGNIAYKAVQRSAKALAIGPLLQGLNKPVNDLSRGATVLDIVNTVLLTAIQAQK